MSRNTRKNIAEDTLAVLENGKYTNKQGQVVSIEAEQEYAVKHTQLYRPEESDALLEEMSDAEGCHSIFTEVTPETTMDAVRRLVGEGANVFALNFASAKNPGGGFLGGSQAQEESIARSTGLYPCLLEAAEYYEVNRQTKTCMYTDHMIYSPKVPVIKDEDGSYADELITVSVLTAPAVNAGVVKHREPEKLASIEDVMKRRIDKVLAIALKHGHDTLVLGAWGCGVFQNNPENIAQYFHEVIQEKYTDKFRKIVFAVYARNPRFITPFQKYFA